MTGHISLAPPLTPQHGLLDPDRIKLQSFTATLDPQGDMLALSPTTKPAKWGFTFTGYGRQQPPTAPAGAQTVPSWMYHYIDD